MENNEKIICPACFSELEAPALVETYFQRDEKKTYSIYECADCNVHFAWPIKNPDEEAYKKLFPGSEYNFELKSDWRIDLVLNTPFENCRDVLDIGCGYGNFMYFAKAKGYDVSGIDYSAEKIEIARNLGLTNLYHDTIDNFVKHTDKKWDLATLLDVLEHLDNPAKLISAVNSLLKENGYLAVAVPNRNYPKILSSSKHFYPPHHLTFWDRPSLRQFLTRNGFSVEFEKENNLVLKNVSDLIVQPIVTSLVFRVKKIIFGKSCAGDKNICYTPSESLAVGTNSILKHKAIRKNSLSVVNAALLILLSPIILGLFVYLKLTNNQGSTIVMVARKRVKNNG
jgi:SAM-dependent methyltransferase